MRRRPAFNDALAALPAQLDYLIQPFVPEVVENGEWSLMFFAGHYSHAVLKRALPGDYRVQSTFGGSATLDDPGAAIIATARAILATVAAIGHADQAYVRVDGIVMQGRFVLMELEFIEPFLFLSLQPQAADVFADQLAQRLVRSE
jgi:hypothetical protein